MQAYRVGLIGLGTVGSGAAEILLDHADRMRSRAGRPIELTRAVVRDVSRDRGLDLSNVQLSSNIDDIINDESIDLGIELIGGLEPARTIVRRLLEAGKDVVTANKSLLCEHGTELFEIARQNGRTIAFEAAVAGGVPVVQAIGQALAANQVNSIQAILNGTSNFILTEMLEKKSSYEDVLAEAQRLGYAEADPSMDVDGTDAAQKLTLLTRLAFGTATQVEQFDRAGIDTLELADLQYARELGYKVKLLAVSKLVDDELEMHVRPTLIRQDRPLAQTDGPFNAVALDGDAVGRIWLFGPGAGRMATASAVIADVIDVAIGRAALTFPRLDLWNEHPARPLVSTDRVSHRYYLRYNVLDRPHVFASIADILGRHEISLASIIQHEAPEQTADGECQEVPVVVMTHRCTEGQLQSADQELDQLESIRPPRICMPVTD